MDTILHSKSYYTSLFKLPIVERDLNYVVDKVTGVVDYEKLLSQFMGETQNEDKRGVCPKCKDTGIHFSARACGDVVCSNKDCVYGNIIREYGLDIEEAKKKGILPFNKRNTLKGDSVTEVDLGENTWSDQNIEIAKQQVQGILDDLDSVYDTFFKVPALYNNAFWSKEQVSREAVTAYVLEVNNAVLDKSPEFQKSFDSITEIMNMIYVNLLSGQVWNRSIFISLPVFSDLLDFAYACILTAKNSNLTTMPVVSLNDIVKLSRMERQRRFDTTAQSSKMYKCYLDCDVLFIDVCTVNTFEDLNECLNFLSERAVAGKSTYAISQLPMNIHLTINSMCNNLINYSLAPKELSRFFVFELQYEVIKSRTSSSTNSTYKTKLRPYVNRLDVLAASYKLF